MFTTFTKNAGRGSPVFCSEREQKTWLRRSIPDARHADALLIPHHMRFAYMVRDAGIEPASEPWEGPVLPLNESRYNCVRSLPQK